MAEWAGKQGNFMGCRVRTYCVMSNHFHILLEVPPAPEVGISDGLLLKRLAASYSEAFVDGVMQELESARKEGDEAVGGGKKGNGKKSREGIMRVCVSHEEAGFETDKWKEVLRIYRRAMGMPLERKNSKFKQDWFSGEDE